MKKTIYASALLLACATSAFAQSSSSVSLSGVVDAGIESPGGNARTGVNSSGNNQSQFTISGKEDLGTGLKATFKISTQLNIDNGASNGFSNNDSYVGLEGSFGKIRAGRSFDPLYTHALTANDRFGVSGYQTLGTALRDNGLRVDNQLLYISPSFHGVTGTVSYGFAEGNKGSNVNDAQAYGLRYATGPIELTAASSRPSGVDTKFVHQLGAAYDFGMARVSLTAQHDNNVGVAGNTDKNAYSLGVTAPVGPGLLWASYDVKEFSNQANGQVAQLGYKYNLSKRTTVYGQVGAKNSSFTGSSSKGAGLGLTHSF